MIRFTCPNCGKRLKSPPGTTGKTARCAKCQTTMTVPEEFAAPAATPLGGAIDSAPIPELGFAGQPDAAFDSTPVPDADEEVKAAKERRARARQRARARRARLRTTGFMMLLVGTFFGIIVAAVALIQYVNRTALSGTVTYEGKPIANGYITFTPVNGISLAASARITNGKFELRHVTAGENVALITAVGAQQFSKTRADPMQLEGKAEPVEDLVSPDAIGNNKVVMIKRGTHVLNFDLKAPPPKEPAHDANGQPTPSR